MEIPIVTLENATKALWAYKRNLAAAVASGHKGAIEGATTDLEMLAHHTPHRSVKDAALEALKGPDSTVSSAGDVRKLATPAAGAHDVAGGSGAATA